MAGFDSRARRAPRGRARVNDARLWHPGSASTASYARCCTSAGARRPGLWSVSSSSGRSSYGARSGARGGST